jgi:hypothetical protein
MTITPTSRTPQGIPGARCRRPAAAAPANASAVIGDLAEAPWEPVQDWTVGYRHGAAGVDVAGNDPGDRAWLDEFLLPWCDVGTAGSAPVCVRMIRSTPIAEALGREWTRRQAAPRRQPPRPCVRLDTQTIAFDGWSADDGLRLVDPVTGCTFIVAGTAVDVVAGEGEEQAQLGLLGLVREVIAGSVAAHRPVVDLHAAAFALDGKAVVIAGPKGAGKTSLLCHVLISAGAALLANDRVFVATDEAPPVACGIPTVVSIRPGTLDAFPRLLARAAEFPALTRIDPSARRILDGQAPLPPSARPALLLSPARLAGRLGAARVAEAPLAAIVIAETSAAVAGFVLERLPREAAQAALDASLYGVAADRSRPTLFGRLAGEAAAGLPPIGDRIARLAAAVPVYRCRLGRDAYDRPAAPLLEALGLGASPP